MKDAFERLRRGLSRLGVEATLEPGASEEEVSALESAIGLTLPGEVREFWRHQNGERPEEAGLAGGFCFVSAKEAQKIARDWEAVREKLKGPELDRLNRSTSSEPTDFVQRQYSLPGWVPLLRDLQGNYVGVDLDPGPDGTVGQVIHFGRDELEKSVLFPSVTELLEWLAEELEEDRILYDEDEEAVVHVDGRLVAVLRSRVRGGS